MIVNTARTQVAASLDASGSGVTLLLTVDPKWLSDPSRVYPVRIDPSYAWTGIASDDAMVLQESPSSNFNGSGQYDSACACYYTIAGYIYPGVHWFGYQHFSGLSAMTGKDIISATWNSFNFTTGASPTAFSLQPASSSWDASTVTYGTRPSLLSNTATGSVTSTSGQWQSVSITSWVANWAAGAWANDGIYVQGDAADFVALAATENGFFSFPYLQVTYNSLPSVPTNPLLQGDPRSSTNSTTPQLSTVVSDIDGGGSHTDYEVWNSTHTSLIASGSGGQKKSGLRSKWNVPSATLSAGTTYSYRFKGDDNTDASAWSAWQSLIVDTSSPNAPGASSTTWSANSWNSSAPSSGTFSFSNGGSSDVTDYLWGIDAGDYPNKDTTSSTITVSPSNGWHDLVVRSRDAAGNLSPSTHYLFGQGLGGFSAPVQDWTAGKNLEISIVSSSGYDAVKLQYRRGDTGTWTDIPAADVKSSGVGIGAWPVACSGSPSCGTTSRSYPTLVWNAAASLTGSGAVKLRGDFYLAGVDQSTFTNRLDGTFDPDKFGSSFAGEPVGPALVNLITGNSTISIPDVPLSGLGVDRTFNSRDQNNATSFFGPGWTSTVGPGDLGYRTLTDNGANVVIHDAAGGIVTFRKQSDSSYIAEDGARPLVLLKCTVSPVACASNTSGRFELSLRKYMTWGFQSPGAGVSDYALVDVASAAANILGYTSWTVVSGVARPTQELAAPPSGVSCTAAPLTTRGCRSIAFSYGASTTATGTAEANWGDYVNDLKTITYTAWDPNKAGGAGMNTIAVASYLYDSTGHLRAVWDPRIVPSTKTRYSYNANGQIATLTPPGEQAWTLNYNPLSGEPSSTGRLANVQRPTLDATGTVNGTATTSVAYQIPLSTSLGGPRDMTSSDVASWAQADYPTDATAIFPADQVPTGTPPASYTRATVFYMNVDGVLVNVAAPNGAITTTEHDAAGQMIRTLSAANRQTALAVSTSPQAQAAKAIELDSHRIFNADDTEITDTYGPAHDVTLTGGAIARARMHVHTDYDQGGPSGGPYDLPTTVTETAAPIDGSSEQDSRVTTNAYSLGADNSGWTLGEPLQTTNDPGTSPHLNLTTTTLYDAVSGQAVEQRTPANPAGGDAHAMRTIYWTAGTNSIDSGCGIKPEWAGLVCKRTPAAQPGTAGLPNLMVEFRSSYNMWDELTTASQTSSTDSRTTTIGYDAAGRQTTGAITATSGSALPTVTTTYDASTGRQATTTDGTRTLTNVWDSLGRRQSYTDASANTSSYSYDTLDRVITRNDGKAIDTYTYDTAIDPRGLPTSVTDNAAGTFSATYNTDGRIASAGSPGGLTATYSYDETGAAIGLSYDKSGTNWIDEQVTSSIHGDWVTHASQLSAQTYSYDTVARLVQTVDTVNGYGCTQRLYSFDADANRTQLTARAPNADNTCASSGGSITSTSFDGADRATTSGYTYDGFGRNTSIPATETPSGIQDNITYFVNDEVAQIAQGTATRTYSLDPSGRDRIWSDGATTHTHHYSDDSDRPTWTAENTAGTTWTRPISVINGLAMVQTNTSGANTFLVEIANLRGDIVATAQTTDTALPSSSQETDEYGVARTGVGTRYDYAGSSVTQRDDLSGLVLRSGRAYNAITGRLSVTDPVSGGAISPSFARAGNFLFYNYWCYDGVTVDVLGFTLDIPHDCRFHISGRATNELQILAHLGHDKAYLITVICAIAGKVRCLNGIKYGPNLTCAQAIDSLGGNSTDMMKIVAKSNYYHRCASVFIDVYGMAWDYYYAQIPIIRPDDISWQTAIKQNSQWYMSGPCNWDYPGG